ncbi:MAG: hypothetical protein G01um101491_109 [Parcubacteria group bacterium Gr01-1014_91]|nr:MAG: hypothetical protein G01um101491_109 [Parcubacteria group bacterium Gr01-1014_91]
MKVIAIFLGYFLILTNTVLIMEVKKINIEWQKATVHVVAEHNKVGAPRNPVKIEEMTPEMLKKLTDPCTIWDWRERGKVCKR